MKPSRVVFEASGGYEKELLFALIAAGLPASRVNAQQVRHFAKALGRRAKTDPVDAAVLQRFGDLVQPAVSVVPSAAQAKRSEEHTSELQSLMRISYAVFCLKKKKNNQK